jgi:serine/threonine protein kinase
MKGYIEDSRQPSSKILVERKETGNFLRSSMVAAAVKERKKEEEYAPQLASLLLSSSRDFFEGSTLGTLPFKGFSKDTTVPNGCFSFAFDYPEGAVGYEPLSVQNLICSEQIDHKLSLNDRFQVAKMISRCLGTLHSDGWLHKSIRSHAIKFFFHKTDKAVMLETRAPYLTDFGFSRPLDGFSAVQYAASTAIDLDRDVYRHPHRFGEPSQFFNMVHDVYSLGVVLLEIGVWKTARQMYDETFKSAKNKPTGEDVQKAFIKRARQELEHSMGSAYRDAVLLCLDGEQLKKHLHKPSFAIEFQKNVVRKVDVAILNPERTDFHDEAEPPRYEDVVSSTN